MPAAFQWLKPFYASQFEWLTLFIASLFEWLRCLNACGVSMASPFLAALFLWLTPFLASLFLWLRRLNGFAVSKFYVVVMRKKYINICSSENYVYFCEIVIAITVMLFTKK